MGYGGGEGGALSYINFSFCGGNDLVCDGDDLDEYHLIIPSDISLPRSRF